MTEKRFLAHAADGMHTSDGAGVKLIRMVGTPQLERVDPFLMLDRMDSDDPDSYIAGFPEHPHRGFETVTIMLEGQMRHKDSVGNDGILGPGDIQWMTAGRGIMHSEMPEMIEGRLKGFQLWVNLPSHLKMMPPSYQDIPASEVPIINGDGSSVRVLSGDYGNATGPAVAQTAIRVLDVRLKADTAWSTEPADGNGLFMCIYEGSITVADNLGREREIVAPASAVFGGNGIVEIVAGANGAETLYCEGAPIGEPIAQYGPFVMNTNEELQQAVDDFNNGRFIESQ